MVLVRERASLREALGGHVPTVDAWYRFAANLRHHARLSRPWSARILSRLRTQQPELGQDVAIDPSDLPTYPNGQRFVSKGGWERERLSNPDASWGHRSAYRLTRAAASTGNRVHASA